VTPTDQTLSETEARLAGIIALAVDSIISVDEQFRIAIFNTGAERTFGYSADEIIGQELDILLPEGVRAVHRQHMEEFANGPVTSRPMGARTPIRGRRKNGEIFPAEASISHQIVGGRHVYTAVLRDVSERRRVEEERQMLLTREMAARANAEALERRASLLVQAGDVLSASLDFDVTLRGLARLSVESGVATFCIVDLMDNGVVRRLEVAHADPGMTAAAKRLSAFPQGNAKYLTRRALDTGEPELIESMTDELLESITDSPEHRAALRALDPASCMVMPLVARGHVLGAIAFCRDSRVVPYSRADLAMGQELARRAAISVDNALLYREARSAARVRDEVLGIVSHDLRNPLSAISMCTSSLLQGAGDEPIRRAELLWTIQESSELAHRLIRDLLDITSIEAGRLSLERRPHDPVMLVASAAVLFEEPARDINVRLTLDVPEHLPFVDVDGHRVQQVLSNLVGNALKFTPAGGEVRIAAAAQDATVRVSVIDTGPGIPPEHVPRIFDRFWHARRDAKVRGTGLGLAIVKGVVDAHGGRVWFEPRAGGGSVFSFTLPTTTR
jgi:PAS domain S-box-containing protein